MSPSIAQMLSYETDIEFLYTQINYRMRVTLLDGRQMVGQMLAFDKVSTVFPYSNDAMTTR